MLTLATVKLELMMKTEKGQFLPLINVFITLQESVLV